jgi:hypothetical protein
LSLFCEAAFHCAAAQRKAASRNKKQIMTNRNTGNIAIPLLLKK